MVKTRAARAHLDKVAEALLGKGYVALGRAERRVILKIAKRETVAIDVNTQSNAGFWDQLADRVASVGGSWGFIFGFCGLLLGWMALNALILAPVNHAFDPYPFIFLNLILSMVAALQAPVIMMSQNRQAAKDRLAAANDYEVNLHAELEIMRLHEKLDALLAARQSSDAPEPTAAPSSQTAEAQTRSE
jgi:uncharacterized membrane protein